MMTQYPALLGLVLAFCFACVRAQFVVDEFGSAEDIYSPDEVTPHLQWAGSQWDHSLTH